MPTESDSRYPEMECLALCRECPLVSDLGQPVLDLLSPQAGERILDLVWGDGTLTEN